MVTAKAVGLALIVASASCCDVADTVEVKITQVPTEVVLTPSSQTLVQGEVFQFSAVVKDAMGYVIPGVEVTWSSENPSVAAVDDSGRVKGQGEGNTHVVVSYGILGDQAGVTVTAVTSPPEGLLFWDDFSSGDFSKHNDRFRWGSGAIPQPGSTWNQIAQGVVGPHGAPVNAMRFQYGTWQEVRFHLTESVSEERTANGASDVAYSEVWLRYWMKVPSNYYHRTNTLSNNKGWFMLWKDSYEGVTAARIEWWPREDGTSRPTVVPAGGGGHTWPAWRAPEHAVGRETYVFLASEYGSWVDYAFRVKIRATADDDTYMVQVYKNGSLIMEWNSTSFSGQYDLWPRDDDPAKAGVDRGYILGYHNSGYDETTVYYITDFKYGHTGASVGITEQRAR